MAAAAAADGTTTAILAMAGVSSPGTPGAAASRERKLYAISQLSIRQRKYLEILAYDGLPTANAQQTVNRNAKLYLLLTRPTRIGHTLNDRAQRSEPRLRDRQSTTTLNNSRQPKRKTIAGLRKSKSKTKLYRNKLKFNFNISKD